MCGRFSQFSDIETLAGRFHAVAEILARPPVYNLAPGMNAGVVVESGGKRRIAEMRWGLVPSWATDPRIGARMINARIETVAEKTSFRRALQQRRCLIPADGFFEWSGEKGHRQPWFVHGRSWQLLSFAGLWERWQPADGGPEWRTFTILTTAATGCIAEIHDRMPIILGQGGHDQWLGDVAMSPHLLADLISHHAEAALTRYRVSTVINTVRNNTIACIAPQSDTI
ncbi:MAG: SOS response-associated peptidase [Pseudomonadota bacterium]